jgi:type II secretion system protein J
MNPARQPINSIAAFTLIEMLIAVSIFAIVLAAINTIFFAALRLRAKSVEAIETMVPIDRALDILKRDFLSIVQTGNLAGPLTSDTTAIGMSQPVALEFYTASGILKDELPWGDIQKIDYWLQPTTNLRTLGGKDLIRGVTRNLLSTTTEAPESQPLLAGVQSLRFSYFDGTNWSDSWVATTTMSNTPAAIKLLIEFSTPRGGAPISPPIQLVFPVTTQSRTNATT